MPKNFSHIVLLSILGTTLLSGCQVVTVKNQAVKVTIANERESILTRDKLSEASLNVLSMTGREAKICTTHPTQCVQELQQIPQIQDEQLYSTASELYLARALALEGSSDCKIGLLTNHKSEEKQKIQQEIYNQCLEQELDMLDKSIRYSYAYMFKTQRGPEDRIFDNRQVQIRDFYNLAIAKLSNAYSLRHPEKEVQRQIKIGKSVYQIDFSNYPLLKDQKIEQLMSSYNLNFSSLRSINRRDGFGSEFLLVLPASNQQKKSNHYVIDPLHFSYES